MDATLVPSQYKGAKTGTSEHTESATRHDAILLFEKAKKRLLDINKWHELCGPASATFQLIDSSGKPINGLPETGNLIRISLPAPPNNQGNGYDWVRIEEMIQKKDFLKDEDVFGFRVRPVPAPDSNNSEAAHFFKQAATSTFLVIRVTTTVSAIEKGRNEIPNTRTGSLIATIRNFAVSIGAWLGFSKTQWGKLMKGILKGPPQD
jgi:hypothetical protein